MLCYGFVVLHPGIDGFIYRLKAPRLKNIAMPNAGCHPLQFQDESLRLHFEPTQSCILFPPQCLLGLIQSLARFEIRLIVLLTVEYPEDGEEQVDNVQVKGDSRSNLLLNMIVAHDKLGVYQDVSTEDERCH